MLEIAIFASLLIILTQKIGQDKMVASKKANFFLFMVKSLIFFHPNFNHYT